MNEHDRTTPDCKPCEELDSCYCCKPRRVALEQDSDYVELHFHTEYSSLDGGSVVKQTSEVLARHGRKSLAITDHGVMNGCPEFYTELKKAGVKPILGCEIYLCEDRFNKANKQTYHLTLIAETTEGYKNLCKISSYAFIDGVIATFGRPRARADYALLREHSRGIIALTGCMAAPTMHAIFKGDLQRARFEVERLIEIFGKDNVYGEIQNVGITVGIPADSEIAKLLDKQPLSAEDAALYDEIDEGQVPLSQTEANRILVERICKPLGLDYVATGDVHYLEESDAIPHDAMICIPTGQLQKGPRRFSLLPRKYYMRSDQEIHKALPDYPEAIATTRVVAERCNAEIEFDRSLLPRYPYPEDQFESAAAYLHHLCEEGLRMRYGAEPAQEARERLNYELGVIGRMGFDDYFLIVWDFFKYAHDNGIPTGPGRGSAAGSIVAYCLEITQLDPLKFGLLFERFLNPERISMPDVDCDFGPAGRGQVMEYVRQKYNGHAGCETAVAQIVTFGRFKAKGALLDAARVLAEPTEEGRAEALKLGRRLSSYVPTKPPGITLREAYAESAQLKKAWKNGGLAQETIKQAQWLEDKIRNNSIHAAAVIIADHPLEDDLPLQRFGEGKPLHVQYDMKFSEQLGLLKMDFLGLRNLDVCEDAIEKVRHVHGDELSLYGIPFEGDDPRVAKTYQLFAAGNTVGTFQFESSGMREALRMVRPTEFTDLIALVALYRPGSMDYIPAYAKRKNGAPFEYLHPDLEEIQAETYGITVYQEQSMQIAQKLAGFTGGQADNLRKAIGKKDKERMAQIKPLFLEGCRKNGVSKTVADAVWADNEKAADYSFNKSHAACYAYVSYVTGFLKANYPNEYMAALLSSVMSKKDEPRLYLTEAKNMGLSVLPPNLNRSLNDFSVQEDEDRPGQYDILFGLTALKGVGDAIVSEIRAERKRSGPYTSMFDLIRRMEKPNKAIVQALIKGGALDFSGARRKGMFNISEESVERIKKEKVVAEREFLRAVCERVDPAAIDNPNEPSWAGEQQMLLEGPPQAKKKTRKLSTWEKRGIEGAAKLAWDAKDTPELAATTVAVEEALSKEALRLARAEIRKELKAAGGTEAIAAAGIADEEGENKSEKDIVDERAEAQIATTSKERKSQARRYAELAHTAITSEWAAREEASGLEGALAADADPAIPVDEWDDLEKLNLERAVLKNYVSGHPLDRDADAWRRYVGDGGGLGEIGEERENQTVFVVGALVGKEEKKMRSGEKWYLGTLEDLTGSRDIKMWPSSVEGREELLEEGGIICCEAIVKEDLFKSSQAADAADDDDAAVVSEEAQPEREMELIATKIYRWSPDLVTAGKTAPTNGLAMPVGAGGESPTRASSGDKTRTVDPQTPVEQPADITPATATSGSASEASGADGVSIPFVEVPIKPTQFTEEWVERLRAICSEYPGAHPVRLIVGEKRYRTELRIDPTTELQAAIRDLLREAPAPSTVAS